VKKVINLTQHSATPAQIEAGVVEPEISEKSEIQALLTFDTLPSQAEIKRRAIKLAREAYLEARQLAINRGEYGCGTSVFSADCSCTCPDCVSTVQGQKVMIGGAPYLMSSLEKELRRWGLVPVYAFSKRECVEEQKEDGSVVKRTVFKFEGFIEAL